MEQAQQVIPDIEELKTIRQQIGVSAQAHAKEIAQEFIAMNTEFASKFELPPNIDGLTPLIILHKIALGDRAYMQKLSDALTQAAVTKLYAEAMKGKGPKRKAATSQAA